MLFFFNKNMTSCFFNFFTTVLVHIRGRSRIFSRGGGGGGWEDFQKNSKVLSTFSLD